MHHLRGPGFLLLLAVSGMALDLRASPKHRVPSFTGVSVLYPESLKGTLEQFGLNEESADLIAGTYEKLRTCVQQQDNFNKRLHLVDQLVRDLIAGLGTTLKDTRSLVPI